MGFRVGHTGLDDVVKSFQSYDLGMREGLCRDR